MIDKTFRKPLGISKYVMNNIKFFSFLGDFMMLDIKEYHNISLILERPFMNTARMLVEVRIKDQVKVRIKDHEVYFHMIGINLALKA